MHVGILIPPRANTCKFAESKTTAAYMIAPEIPWNTKRTTDSTPLINDLSCTTL
jgi:hypothetical protein